MPPHWLRRHAPTMTRPTAKPRPMLEPDPRLWRRDRAGDGHTPSPVSLKNFGRAARSFRSRRRGFREGRARDDRRTRPRSTLHRTRLRPCRSAQRGPARSGLIGRTAGQGDRRTIAQELRTPGRCRVPVSKSPPGSLIDRMAFGSSATSAQEAAPRHTTGVRRQKGATWPGDPFAARACEGLQTAKWHKRVA